MEEGAAVGDRPDHECWPLCGGRALPKMGFGGAKSAGSAIEHYKDACEKKLLPARYAAGSQKKFFFDHLTREDIKAIALRGA